MSRPLPPLNPAEFKSCLDAHDRLLSAMGITIWVGMEPTFTRRFTESPEWLSEALGQEKLEYAYAILRQVYQLDPGGMVLHTLGRQYAGEELPRWSLGYYHARNAQLPWEGPADPCIGQSTHAGNSVSRVDVAEVEMFWSQLHTGLDQGDWQACPFTVHSGLKYRLLLRCDGMAPRVDFQNKPQLARASVHSAKIPLNGLVDELAGKGDFLLCLDRQRAEGAQYSGSAIVIELPEIPSVAIFTELLQRISQAARRAALDSLILQGFPPPVDASVAWTTITPDPAVIEINQAPALDAVDFFERIELCYRAAREAGLDPFRLHYNGVVSDSGGGGQFTLGGPEPLASPFFRYPELLPRLVRYFNRHPALSYWFAPASIGSSSQSPRSDEGVRESFREMSLALEQLEKAELHRPELIWRSLSPFLVDPSGNPHRSELNIEKLWNPYLPGRGCLGLVEFRAFRMSRSPQCAAAIAVLLRSIVAMLSREDKTPELANHGLQLHDRFALPFFLKSDLMQVFRDLEQSGFAIPEPLQGILLEEPVRRLGRAEYQGCLLEIEQALEFWPLVGDVASQERGGSRLVDASTTRLQIMLRIESGDPSRLDAFELGFEGYRLPLRAERDGDGPVKLIALRYRNFLPMIGLHPGIRPRQSIGLLLIPPEGDGALEVTFHEWHPQGLAYPGLPQDLNDAQARRAERVTTRLVELDRSQQAKILPPSTLSEYCVDIRRLPP